MKYFFLRTSNRNGTIFAVRYHCDLNFYEWMSQGLKVWGIVYNREHNGKKTGLIGYGNTGTYFCTYSMNHHFDTQTQAYTNEDFVVYRAWTLCVGGGGGGNNVHSILKNQYSMDM